MKTKGQHGPGGKSAATPLDCQGWETLLTDALDGTLSVEDAQRFQAHQEACLQCTQQLEEAQRGREWLAFLHVEPEVPADLVTRILARTSGAAGATLPTAPGLLTPAGAEAGWLGASALPLPAPPSMMARSAALLHRHAAESRLLMTVAMAFFSLAFTLNLAGVQLKQIRLGDLRPAALATSISREYYTASAHVVRYYEGLRFVYELETRVSDLRRDSPQRESAPAEGGAGSGSAPSPAPSQDRPGTRPQSSTAPEPTPGAAEREGTPRSKAEGPQSRPAPDSGTPGRSPSRAPERAVDGAPRALAVGCPARRGARETQLLRRGGQPEISERGLA